MNLSNHECHSWVLNWAQNDPWCKSILCEIERGEQETCNIIGNITPKNHRRFLWSRHFRDGSTHHMLSKDCLCNKQKCKNDTHLKTGCHAQKNCSISRVAAVKHWFVCWVPWATSDKCRFTSCSNNNSNSNERPVLSRIFDGDGSSSCRAGWHGAEISSMWISIAEVGFPDVEPIYNLRKFVKMWTQNNILSHLGNTSCDTRREGKERIQQCFKKRYSILSIWTLTIHHSPGSNSDIPVPFPCLSWTFSFVDEAVPKNKFDLSFSVHTAGVSIL